MEHMTGGLTSFSFLDEIRDTHILNYGIKPLKELSFTMPGVGEGGEKSSLFLAAHEFGKNALLGRLQKH